MDKEDCIHLLLSTLRKPSWKRSASVSDWDLKNVLWNAGVLLNSEQGAALMADIKRRALIAGRDRRHDGRIVSMWGVRITPAGEEWLLQREKRASTAAGAWVPTSPGPADQGDGSPETASNSADVTPPREAELL